MPNGFALENADSVDVVTAYAAAVTEIPSYATTPGWQVIGEFFLPLSCEARLDMVAMVSDVSLVCRGRLYDVTALAPVSGSTAQTSALVGTRVLSGIVTLPGARLYQIHAECTGHAPGDPYFAIVETASISD